ncbi:MAG TPA: extracellular solute-binding protein [Anaerolineales bacterium]|nr:extracellular solute-binding protein [Anaerolineales bacterium]
MKPRHIRLVCILLSVSGCAAPDPSPPPTATATAAPPAATASPAPTPLETDEPLPAIDLAPEDIAGVALELWHPWDGDQEALLEGLVAAFNAGNDHNLQVTAVRRHDLHADVAAALATGSPPDLAFGFSYHARSWSRIAAPVDWNLYLMDLEWGLSAEERLDFYPEFLVAAANAGLQTGLPFYRTAEVLLYNATWAAELGFTGPPETPEALAEQSCAANASLRTDSDPGNDGEGGLMLGNEPIALAAWMAAFGGGLDPLSETESYAFDRAENITAFAYLRGLLDDLCAWLPEGVYPHDEFAGRSGLLLPSTLAGLAPQAAAMQAAGSSDVWTAIPYPAVETGRAPLLYGPDLVLLPTTPERQLAAWVFARWVLSPENLAGWSDTTGYFPVRRSALAGMAQPPPQSDAWLSQGLGFTPPASWVDVQWAVSEMSRMLFSPFTPADDVAALALELDAFAEEIHQLSLFP